MNDGIYGFREIDISLLTNICPDSWPVKLYPQSSHFHILFLFWSDRHQRCYNSPKRNVSFYISFKDQDM